MAAAYLSYFFWQPQAHSNYGELLSAQPLPDAVLRLTDGQSFRLSQLKGKWLLVQINDGDCSSACMNKLYIMRQIRLAQGRDMDRIERVWLITNNAMPAAKVTEEYKGTWQVDMRNGALLSNFRKVGQTGENNIYLVDPLGNLMMRFPENPDPRKMIKDLQRLLKVSQIG